jgi:hypothetical protein
MPHPSASQTKQLPEEEFLRQAGGDGILAERMGLTPDWLVATCAFSVFQLPVRLVCVCLLGKRGGTSGGCCTRWPGTAGPDTSVTPPPPSLRAAPYR